jgi:hypothetical protein
MRLDDRGLLVTISLAGQTVNVAAGAVPIAIEPVQNSTPVFNRPASAPAIAGENISRQLRGPRRANPVLPGNTARSQWPAELDVCVS